jgi:hypothetical protein
MDFNFAKVEVAASIQIHFIVDDLGSQQIPELMASA